MSDMESETEREVFDGYRYLKPGDKNYQYAKHVLSSYTPNEHYSSDKPY